MRVANNRRLRRLLLAFIYTMGVLGIVASSSGGGCDGVRVDGICWDVNIPPYNPPSPGIWDAFEWDGLRWQ